jgi:uncharacterized protein (DUF433 family)
MTPATATHIQLDERGVAWIDDTNVKVVEVALETLAYGARPEEIHEQHQGHLTLAQIHAALAWFYDHRQEMDADILRQLQQFDQLRTQTLDSPGRQRLRGLGKLP